MGFLDENYLLKNRTAKELYEKIAGLPIVDLHNHSSVREIVENKCWENIWEVEAATDHYVWQLMRRKGIPEETVTGNATDKEKWDALAEIFPDLAGNPTYEWIHLDLRRRFGITDNISRETGDRIWEKTAAALQKEEMRPQSILKAMNVKVMCTTDEPTADLKFHKRAVKEIDGIDIYPTWRPDRALKIELAGWPTFLEELTETTGTKIINLETYLEALQKTHDNFDRVGCRASDHSLAEPFAYFVEEKRAANIFARAFSGDKLDKQEINDFKAFLMNEFGKMNEKTGWTMQLHTGVVRNYRQSLYRQIGADAGGDIINQETEVINNLRYFLNQFDGKLNIVLYYLDPGLLPILASIVRAYPNLHLGAPWWFNDSPYGIGQHLKMLGSVDLFSNYTGMVTDSRKLLSYGSRTEMFRRVLSSVLGEMVELGQIPYEIAEKVAASICYYHPFELFFGKA